MKQYLDQQQTAKLIELGLADSIREERYKRGSLPKNYSIGELIEILPQYLDYKGGVSDIPIDYYALTIRQNVVMYCDPYMDWVEIQCNDHKELIDNLYDMVTILKEEEVI